jgi:hypothetical protein
MTQELGCTYKALKSMARILKIKSLKEKNFYKLEKLIEDVPYNNYWWGFILADGHISKKGQLSVIAKESDSDHLKILSNYLNVNLICRFIKTSYSEGMYCNFTCQDSKYGHILKNIMGVTENKTYTSINYDWINTKEKFLSVFIGFYDGDGCISRSDIGTISCMKIECHYNWKDFLIFCSESLQKYFNVESTVYITTKGSSAIRIYKKDNIKLLYSEGKNLGLSIMERKWK